MKNELKAGAENREIINTSVMTFQEACQYLKVSKSFLYKATSNRTIPFHKPTGGKMLRFRKEDLDAWQLQNRQPTLKEIADRPLR